MKVFNTYTCRWFYFTLYIYLYKLVDMSLYISRGPKGYIVIALHLSSSSISKLLYFNFVIGNHLTNNGELNLAEMLQNGLLHGWFLFHSEFQHCCWGKLFFLMWHSTSFVFVLSIWNPRWPPSLNIVLHVTLQINLKLDYYTTLHL